MYKVRYGGKKGKTIELVESPDMVAIRTKDNQQIEQVAMSRHSRELVQESTEVASFPEAGVSVRRVSAEGERAIEQRDATRAALKEEEGIRFAGRVLQDADSGEVMLYTENFFVKFKDAVSEKDCQAVLDKYSLKVKSKLPFAPNSYFVEAPEGTGLKVFEMAEKILAEPNVEFCHPELVQERRFKGIHPLQWHLAPTRVGEQTIDAHVNIESAWKITRGKGAVIAVIDDGIDIDHPEFAGRVLHPFAATRNNDDPRPQTPDDNHGTPCAGMACAAGLRDGASGTAPEATLIPIRLRSGLGSMAEANAFAWAADHGADVISCSWGPTDGEWWNPDDPTHHRTTPLPDSTRLAMDYARTKGRGGKGCVILFAAGNGNEDTAHDGYAGYPGVIAVAACNDTGRRAVYSDFGKAVWVCFPSGDYAWRPFRHPAPLTQGLRTTDRQQQAGYAPGNYTDNFGGTSGACPGMAGVVALMLSVNPQLTSAEVKDLVRRSTRRIDEADGEYGPDGHSIWYGYGRIDAGLAVENALKAAKGGGSTPTKPTTTTPAASAALPLVGAAQFSGMKKEVALAPGRPAGDFPKPKKLLTLRLQIQPPIPGLKLRYKVNVPTLGMQENSVEGQYVGTINARQRIIGLAVWLEGTEKAKYDVEYTVRFQGDTTPLSGKNGAFLGSEKKTGKTVVGVAVSLVKRR